MDKKLYIANPKSNISVGSIQIFLDEYLKDNKGKLYIYDVLGMECKAFSILKGEYFDIYAEYTNEINMYIR